MKKLIISLFVMFGLFTVSSAHAHYLWFNIDNYQLKKGETAEIKIGWGHGFLRDEVIEERLLNKVRVLDPSGNEIPLSQVSPTQFRFTPPKSGNYIVLANIHPVFLSKTPDGYKRQSKKGIENVLSCVLVDIRTKAIIQVDGKEVGFSTITGDPLEIIPIKNYGALKEGEVFPIKVLYNGKPISHAEVHATYEGFSDKSDNFAISTKTDEQGEAYIKILKRGKWFVNVIHETSYPDPEECDKYKYNYNFTFEIK